MLLTVNGKVIQAYYAEKNGTTYLTVADAETLTSLELTSNKLRSDEVKPYVDQMGRIDLSVKVTKFQQADRFEVLAFRFTPLAAAESTKAPSTNGAKVPA